MEPTVHAGDRLVVFKTAYDLRVPFSDRVIAQVGDPSRGDVVVLDSPEQDLLLLKRIVAVPGDRVAVHSGQVWIDGEPVPIDPEEGALVEKLGDEHGVFLEQGGGPDLSSTLVPHDHYLVLGDNRGDSHDGRSFGLVSRGAIRGRAARVYFSQGEFDWRGL
jgi:signal peptidase I